MFLPQEAGIEVEKPIRRCYFQDSRRSIMLLKAVFQSEKKLKCYPGLKSKTCFDHIISGKYIDTETLRATISNQYTVLGCIPLKTKKYGNWKNRKKNKNQSSVTKIKFSKTTSTDSDKRLCADAIASINEFMRSEIDNKATRKTCFIDLQKAFDTLDHWILLKTLERYGYRGPVLKMIKSFFSDRWQLIKLKGTSTDNKQILTGVLQGSKRGLFLFLLYMNDLDASSGHSKVTRFADETTLKKVGNIEHFSIQQDNELVLNWLVSNNSTVNAGKCKRMFFRSRNPHISTKNKIFLRKTKNFCEYSGENPDKLLWFHQNIDYVVKKLN